MSKTNGLLCLGATALLLSGGASMAQEACSSYVVKAGDNLRNIARGAYGDPDMYRVIFEANVAAIGPKADLIEVGIMLTLPCDPNAPQPVSAEAAPAAGEAPVAEPVAASAEAAPEAEAVIATSPEAMPETGSVTTASAAAPEPAAEVVPISFVTGNGYAPFTDETLPGGGMFTQLVEMAAFRADPQMAYDLTFINDWQAHIDALLPAKAYDLSFPWSRPSCETPETLSAGDLNRCENFVFSDPFYEIVEAFFATPDSGLADATGYDEFAGKRICRPEGYTTGVLDAAGLSVPGIDLMRPAQVEDCFSALVNNKVDLVALDADVADAAIAAMGLTDKVVQNQQLTTVQTLHVIAHKSNADAIKTLEMLNQGIVEMYESGEWYDIVSSALAQDRLQQ